MAPPSADFKVDGGCPVRYAPDLGEPPTTVAYGRARPSNGRGLKGMTPQSGLVPGVSLQQELPTLGDQTTTGTLCTDRKRGDR